MGHLVAPPGPTMVPAGVSPLVPPHQSMGNGQETHLQAFSTVDSKWCVIKGQKEASHGSVTHHLVCQVPKWTNGVHTHTLLHPKGPHTEGRGPTPKWPTGRRPTYAARCPSVTPPPLLQTHARKHTWGQSYALIYGSSRSV